MSADVANAPLPPSPMADPGIPMGASPSMPAPADPGPAAPMPQWSPAAAIASQGVISHGGTMAQAMAAAQTVQQGEQNSQQANQSIDQMQQFAGQAATTPGVVGAAQNPAGAGPVGNPNGELLPPGGAPPRTVPIQNPQGKVMQVDLTKLSPGVRDNVLSLYRQQQGARVGNVSSKPLADLAKTDATQTKAALEQYDPNKKGSVAQLQNEAADQQATVETNIANAKLRQQQLEQRNAGILAADNIKTNSITQRHVMEAGWAVDDATAAQKNFMFDPERFSKNQSVGGSVLSVIGMLLGGVGQGLLHSGSNAGVDAYNAAIRRDVDSQKLEYEKLGQDTENAKGAYALARQKGLDEKDAYSAAMAANHAAAQQAMDMIGSQYGGPLAQARAAAFKANSAAEQQTHRQSILQNAQARGLQNAVAQIDVQKFNVNKQVTERGQDLEMLRAGAKQGAVKPIPNEQMEKIDGVVNGLKALLSVADKFKTSTTGKGSTALGRFVPNSDTRNYLNTRHDAAGALAATFDPGARNQANLIERAEDSLPSQYTNSKEGLNRFRTQYDTARSFLVTRLQNESAQGFDVSGIANQIEAMDKQAGEIGIYDFGAKSRQPIAGGKGG